MYMKQTDVLNKSTKPFAEEGFNDSARRTIFFHGNAKSFTVTLEDVSGRIYLGLFDMFVSCLRTVAWYHTYVGRLVVLSVQGERSM